MHTELKQKNEEGDIMFRKCKKDEYQTLMEYLKKEEILNTFIISDLDNYGFDKDFQVTYMDTDEKGACIAVALIFHNNLIISGSLETMDFPFLETLLTDKINNVMGQGELVEAFDTYLNKHTEGQRNYIEKTMYTLQHQKSLETKFEIELAGLKDVDTIYEFIMGIPEISFLYKEKSMIHNRIESGEGIHLFIKEKGEIIAHANSAAGTSVSSMLGGVSVKKEYRNRGYGKGIVSAVCENILQNKKTVCLFSKSEYHDNLFIALGFEPYKKWGTLGL